MGCRFLCCTPGSLQEETWNIQYYYDKEEGISSTSEEDGSMLPDRTVGSREEKHSDHDGWGRQRSEVHCELQEQAHEISQHALQRKGQALHDRTRKAPVTV